MKRPGIPLTAAAGAASFALVFLLLPSRSPASPSADVALEVLLSRVEAAYGGPSGLERSARSTQKGTVVSPTRGQGSMQRVFERPDRLRAEVSFPGESPEIRILEGVRGTRNGVAVDGPPLQAMVLQAGRMDLPYLLVQGRSRAHDLGTVERDGQLRRAVEINLGGGLAVTAEIEPQTGHILRSVGTFPMPGAGEMEFITDYSEFDTLSGVVVARHERNQANGQLTGEITIESIVVPSLPPESRAR